MMRLRINADARPGRRRTTRGYLVIGRGKLSVSLRIW